ncbi:MAG: hypothetical protein WC553_02270 [Patescibacteria group bacterium]|jgi:hypothetical protein
MKRLIPYLFYFKTLIWIVLAWLYYTRYFTSDSETVYWLISILLLVNGLLYAIFGYLLKYRTRWIFWLSALFVAGNIILTIADQVGWIDWISLATDVALLTLLFWHRKNRLPSPRG